MSHSGSAEEALKQIRIRVATSIGDERAVAAEAKEVAKRSFEEESQTPDGSKKIII